MKNHLNASLIVIFCFFGCEGKTDKKLKEKLKKVEVFSRDQTIKESDNSLESKPDSKKSKYVEVKTWIDDFRNFRMAIYNNDVSKLKNYFNFPFDDKGKTILYVCNISESDRAERKHQFKDPQLFYEADLEKYYKNLFDERFEKAILKIKSEQLFSKHSTVTKLFVDDDLIYKLHADYNDEQKTLMLNMSIGNNARYPDGNYVSEGEHNIIYHFKIIDNKKMMLVKMDFAG